jgi:hypothetical protein
MSDENRNRGVGQGCPNDGPSDDRPGDKEAAAAATQAAWLDGDSALSAEINIKAAIAFLAASLVGALSLGVYHWLSHQKSSPIATADIAEIVKIRELQFTRMLAKPNVTDKDRQEAYVLVSKVGPEIEAALDAIQKDCQCVLLVKSAVLAGESRDMTEDLKRRLGLAGLSSKAMMDSMPAVPSAPTPQGVAQ